MSTTPCSACGKPLAAADILYTEAALPICAECAAKGELVRDEQRAARNIRIASFTCLGAALFGFAAFSIGIGLFFYAAAVISVASGIFAGQVFGSTEDDRFTKHIPPAERTLIIGCTVAGLAIASFETLVILGVVEWIPPWLR